ncbi:sperm receptor for egg jelly-like, partial [Pocillopora damicornis]|uniref:sperm receptor for egg jelly-like n=1 Tax=Pocillopora damicornis TaxID=46731 RepID=UPI000F54FE00
MYYHYLDETSGKRKLDLVAVISGGAEVTRGLQKNITLNASLSYDPEVAHGNRSEMKFTWHYSKVTGNHSGKQAEAKTEKDLFTAVNQSAINYNKNLSGELVSLNTEALSVNQTYIVKLVVTKDIRISTVYQVIHLIEGDPPEIYQRCFFNCQPKVSPLVKLSIKSQCRGLQCSKILSYEWRLYQQFKRNTSFTWQRKHNLRLITSTPLSSSDIVIKGGSLTGGNTYRLALFITITDGLRGMNAYDFSTARPPTGGNCSITPPSGISLKTDFNLRCSNWESDNTPLSYQFQYRLEDGLYDVLHRGVNNNISTSSIPPGHSTDNFTVKVIATVTDNFGISASPVTLTVQISPYQNVSSDVITNLLLANDSLFQKFIEIGNLRKAVPIANSVLLSVSQETSMNFQERYEVMNYILEKISPLEAKTVSDLLQKSSVIGSALKALEEVPHQSLNISLSAVSSMTSLLWSIAQKRDVADIPLTNQSAENLASCLNTVLKTAAVAASEDSKSSFQPQGKLLVKISMKALEKVADSMLALTVPDEKTISSTVGKLSLTLGRYSLQRLSGLKVKAGKSRFILPSKSQLLLAGVNKTSFVDVQMFSFSFNPYTWDGTKERVGSDVVTLHLKNNDSELIKVSDLTEDIVIITPLKLQQISATEKSWYFTKNDDLRFHE